MISIAIAALAGLTHAAAPYRVRLEISGFSKPYHQYFNGVDPIHALLTALWMVPDIVYMLAGGAPVTWLGSKGLGFRYGDRLTDGNKDPTA